MRLFGSSNVGELLFMNEDLIKEVYAKFGLTYYFSEVIHKGLCNIYTLQGFQELSDITQPRIEERLHYAFSLTLGGVIEEIKSYISEELAKKLEILKVRRNFLAHYFWFEKVNLLYSEQGIIELISFLENEINDYLILNDEIELIENAQLTKFQIPKELINNCLNEIIDGKTWEPIIPQRKLKKTEILISVWEINVSNGETIIFEFDDNSLWQLSDIGLGWTNHKKIETTWKKREDLSKYLPAKINPRPQTSIPWCYTLELRDHYELWVQKSDKDKKYRWGIRCNRQDKI